MPTHARELTVAAGVKYRQAIAQALCDEMERQPESFIVGIDIRPGGTFMTNQGLLERLGPGRVLDAPISETALVGLCVGAAAVGMRPVVEIQLMDFVTVAMDQIVNQMAKMKYMFGGKAKLPIVLLTHQGGGRSMGAQHSQTLEAWFCHIPGLKVVTPSTPYDAKGLMVAALRDDNPVIFITNKLGIGMRGDVPDELYEIPLGRADIKREGSDVTVVALSSMVQEALAAAEQLAERGISVEVVDPRTLSPLDSETILVSVQKTGRAVVAHEAVTFCGVGAEIAAQISEEGFDYLDAPVKRVGAPFSPVPFNPAMEKAWLPGKPEIIAAIESVVPSAATT